MRLPPARYLVPLVAATAAALGLTGLLWASGAVGAAVALQLAVSVITASAVAAAAMSLRRQGIQLRRLRGDLADLASGQAALLERVETGLGILGGLSELPKSLRGARADQKAGFDRLTDHVTARGRADYEQQVAWQELRDYLKPGPFMPALRDWAASPDVLRLLVEQIRDRAPKLVVECGSGASSVWLGYALRRAGAGRLVAIEHDERYAALSRDLVASHGLSDIVEVRVAPLRDWSHPGDDAPAQRWYDTDALTDLKDIDLLFVDGPPARTGPQARYPAGPVLLPRCSTDAVVVIDDTIRADEREIGDRWLAENPDLRRVRRVALEKGADVFTLSAPGEATD
ncbi:class I SAM-dependent methyltransferase [Nocardiopsis sediminis]|uniref:Class I SAM-dependent methyltransferase n=1 Tax=Nocardiopsis sediminis TaxID=1778267 RepID=A0ABV8FRM0_9ACTN